MERGEDDALTAQIHGELSRIVPIVSALTGLPSNWNGELVLVPNAKFRGKKLFSCSILLREALARQELRWRTLIHEVLHAVSVGYIRSDYEALSGWEEGVVEQLQRLLRRDVLAALSVNIAESTFQETEVGAFHNKYIEALETLRQALQIEDVTPFYIRLLSTPIAGRQGYVYSLGSRLPRPERLRFLETFSVCSAILKERDVLNVNF